MVALSGSNEVLNIYIKWYDLKSKSLNAAAPAASPSSIKTVFSE